MKPKFEEKGYSYVSTRKPKSQLAAVPIVLPLGVESQNRNTLATRYS
jgi:hypothetical protein